MKRLFKWWDSEEGKVLLKRVANNDTELKRLDLAHKKCINDADIEQIASALDANTIINSLDLSDNNICGNGGIILSRIFKKNTTITYLHLSSNFLGDEGAREFGYVLRFSKALNYLDFSLNKISDEGVKALASGLKVNSTLEYLSLSGNDIGDQGAYEMAEALKLMTTLKHLDLSLNHITNVGAKHLETALYENKSLIQLNISNNTDISTEQKKSLKLLLMRNQNGYAPQPEPQIEAKPKRRITFLAPRQAPDQSNKESSKKKTQDSLALPEKSAKTNSRPISQQFDKLFNIVTFSRDDDENQSEPSPISHSQRQMSVSAARVEKMESPTTLRPSGSSSSASSPSSSSPTTKAIVPPSASATPAVSRPETAARKPDVIAGFEIVRELGTGGFGRVYEVRQLNQQSLDNQSQQQKGGVSLAMKVLPCGDDHKLTAAVNEALVAAYRHSNIVEIKKCLIATVPSRLGKATGGSSLQRHACLVMEFCEGGDLRSYIIRQIKDNRKCKEKTAWRWLQQACSALELVHSKQLIHRDIKPENVLLTKGKKANIKLTDFGIARMLIDEKELVKTQIGTLRYVAPEMPVNGAYSVAVDMWGIGVVFFELLTRNIHITPSDVKKGLIDKALLKPEHADETAYFNRVTNPEYLATVRKLIVDLRYSPDLADVVANLMEPDPKIRRSAQDILKLIEQRNVSVDSSVSPSSTPMITVPIVSPIAGVNNFAIAYNDLEFLDELGEGGFGQVWKARWNGRGGGMAVAVKMLLGQRPGDVESSQNRSPTPRIQLSSESRQEFESEIAVMFSMSFPNVVRVFGANIDPAFPLCIVQEFAERGSLYDVLHNKSLELDWPLRWRMAKQAAMGLNYLHNCNPVIIHRDIKSPNFLVDSQWSVKICDFGLAKIRLESTAKPNDNKDGQLGMPTGSVRWSAPETMLLNPVFSTKSDVYSLGMTMWEIVSRKVPFDAQLNNTMLPFLVQVQGVRPEIPEGCPEPFKNLIQQCFRAEPAERPSCAKILKTMDQEEPKIIPQPSR